jgi:capsular exopolysaccharide synthesis family protein
VGSAGIYAYEYLNDLPRSTDDVEEAADAPVLGAIPGIAGDSRETAQVAAGRRRSAAAEAYRLVRTNIQFIDVDHPPRTILVTSPQAEEGKSTTASNLALAFAEGGKKTTLVDGDLRRPSLQRLFDDGPRDGLTNLLLGEGLNGHARPSPAHPNLVIITSGPIPPNSADLLNSDRMRETLQELQEHSDIVIFDSPPLLPIADATILSALTDGVVLVVDPQRTHRRDIRKAREAIEAVGGRVLGVVINRVRTGTALSYPYTDYYYSYGADKRTKTSSS